MTNLNFEKQNRSAFSFHIRKFETGLKIGWGASISCEVLQPR